MPDLAYIVHHEPAAAAAFTAATYANQMAEIDHENEPVLLSLDRLDGNGIGISQQTRKLLPSTQMINKQLTTK